MGTSENCSFWCNGPTIKGPKILLVHQKQIILALFLKNLAILRYATLSFSGLELVPKSSKKLIGGLSCLHKGQKCIQIL